jgi:hypothetical protein
VSAPGKPGFNPIFGQFVATDAADSDSLLRGLVAYGLYKIAKREWATELFEAENRPPKEDELAAYVRTWTPSQIDGKREQAATILAQYADAVVEAATPAIEKVALRGSLWRAVGHGVAANVLYTLLLILILWVLKWAGVDLLGLAEKIGAH